MARDSRNDVDDDDPQRDEPSVGETLRQAREKLGLTLDQVSADLRIEPQFLAALEEDDFGSFAAPVYTKGYLRQYAVRVNLDDRAVLTQYYRQVGAQDAPMLRSRSLELGPDQRHARWLVTGSAVVLLVAVVVVWLLNSSEPATDTLTAPASELVAGETPVLSPEIITEVPLSPVISDPVTPEPAQVAVPAPDPTVEPAAEPEPVSPETAEDASLETPEAAADAPSLLVEIVFEEDCWTEVIDARGERLFYGLGSAGARTRFDATPPLSFFLGNASGVQLLVNDQPFAIPSQNRQGNLARFVILEADN